jgi:hypothetical protein
MSAKKLKGIARFGHSGIFLSEFQKLFLFGGFDAEANSITDLVVSKSETTKDNPDPLIFGENRFPKEIGGRQFCPGFAIESGFCFFGGKSNGYNSDLIEVNISKKQQTFFLFFENIACKGDLPSPRYGHSFVLHNQTNYAYLFGGYLDTSETSNELFRFDSQSKEWKKITPSKESAIPPPRYHHSMVIVQDQLIVFGGSGSVAKSLYQDTWVFNFSITLKFN